MCLCVCSTFAQSVTGCKVHDSATDCTDCTDCTKRGELCPAAKYMTCKHTSLCFPVEQPLSSATPYLPHASKPVGKFLPCHASKSGENKKLKLAPVSYLVRHALNQTSLFQKKQVQPHKWSTNSFSNRRESSSTSYFLDMTCAVWLIACSLNLLLQLLHLIYCYNCLDNALARACV